MKMSEQRQAVLIDLNNGAWFMVTKINQDNRNDIIELQGGRKHKDNVVESFFYALKKEGRLEESDSGLFEGCGQRYELIR